jgi:hypothetical protein
MSIRIKNKNQVVSKINNAKNFLALTPIWDNIQDCGCIHNDDVDEMIALYERKEKSIEAKFTFK